MILSAGEGFSIKTKYGFYFAAKPNGEIVVNRDAVQTNENFIFEGDVSKITFNQYGTVMKKGTNTTTTGVGAAISSKIEGQMKIEHQKFQ